MRNNALQILIRNYKIKYMKFKKFLGIFNKKEGIINGSKNL